MIDKLSPLGDALEGLRSRRDFLRIAGLGGAAVALAACGDAGGAAAIAGVDSSTPQASHLPAGTYELDFATDIGVLNYAYALEQLEAAFYTAVVANDAFASTFSANEQIILTDLRDHEIAHREFLKAALGEAALPGLTPEFSGINFTNRMTVLETARTFEDLGVGAYNGAGKFLRNADFLVVAGKIVSVEARHAAAIRSVLEPRTGAFAPNAFDPALAPSAVLTAADPFIVETLRLINVPTA